MGRVRCDAYQENTQADKNKDVIEKHPGNHSHCFFLANSVKEKSMNHNAKHVNRPLAVGNEKLQIPRNFSSIDFVIKPGDNGFSNYEQSTSNDS